MNRRQLQAAAEQARRHAVELGEAGEADAIPELLRLCRHAGPTVRRAAASALGKLSASAGIGAAVLALGELVRDPHPQVRQYALLALGRIGDESALPAVRDAVNRTTGPDYVMAAALKAIEQIEAAARARRESAPVACSRCGKNTTADERLLSERQFQRVYCSACFDAVFIERRNFDMKVQNRKTILAADRTVVQSKGERLIADWLSAHGIEYRYDDKFQIIQGFAVRPDFYLPRYDLYLEYWGLDTTDYKIGMLLKQKLYQQEGKKLVSLYPADLAMLDAKLAQALSACNEMPGSQAPGTSACRSDGSAFRRQLLAFFESLRLRDGEDGRYRYAACQTQPVLYASLYAAMTRHLLRDLDGLAAARKAEWAVYIQSFQDQDGFFKDPPLAHPGSWYEPPHMEWCGWRHLTCHAIIGLAALGAVAAREFAGLRPYYDEPFLRRWLAARDFAKIDYVGNEVLNLGQLLQYARDFQDCRPAGRAMELVLDWLDAAQDAATGLWGASFAGPEERNKAYQGAYHFFLLYAYDRRPIRHAERIVDVLLSLQTPQGGFGIHADTSGCEDLDAIDPLVRLAPQLPRRRAEIEGALRRALEWVPQNRTPDGGFAFIRRRDMMYGSRLMYSGADEGSAFAAWWRTLSLAMMSQAVRVRPWASIPWQFTSCPGYQNMARLMIAD